VLEGAERVREIRVKQSNPGTHWIWGAFKMPSQVFRELNRLWLDRARQDEYIGTLVNAWIAGGGVARGIKAGESYVDVGTLDGYRAAMQLLALRDREPSGREASIGSNPLATAFEPAPQPAAASGREASS